MKRRIFTLFASLCVAITLYGVGCGGAGPIVDPLPSAPDIQSMKARYYDSALKTQVEFTVPPAHWESILEALRPAVLDPNPAKWVILGELSITLRDGRSSWAGLYSSGSVEPGAFSAGESHDRRLYYRGGTTARLRAALRAAYDDASPEAKHEVITVPY